MCLHGELVNRTDYTTFPLQTLEEKARKIFVPNMDKIENHKTRNLITSPNIKVFK